MITIPERHPLASVKASIERLQADARQLTAAELEERLRVLHRHIASLESLIESAPRESRNPLQMDHTRRQVKRSTRVIQLTALEYRLLITLDGEAGHGVPADRLIESIWGRGGGDKIMLKQLVHRLRRKLESEGDSALIETIPGVGYALITSLFSDAPLPPHRLNR